MINSYEKLYHIAGEWIPQKNLRTRVRAISIAHMSGSPIGDVYMNAVKAGLPILLEQLEMAKNVSGSFMSNQELLEND